MTKGADMNEIRLTTRGKVLLGIAVALVAYVLASAALGAVTPDECKVPTEQMSQGCIALIYK
jgi:lysophospholipid acyltransferase (LPLAT)-like uncharacterized protein